MQPPRPLGRLLAAPQVKADGRHEEGSGPSLRFGQQESIPWTPYPLECLNVRYRTLWKFRASQYISKTLHGKE